MVFGVFDFLQKRTNERIRLYYYDNSSRLVFVRFLEEIEDTKKPFQNYLTFSENAGIWKPFITIIKNKRQNSEFVSNLLKFHFPVYKKY